MTIVIAHRGASAGEVENSLAAFRRALLEGADGIELDIHATNDGEFVVRHDEVLAGSPIAALGIRDIRMHVLENGEIIPTLSDALAVIGSAAIAFIEVKGLAPEYDRRLLETLAGCNSRCHLHSFDHRIVRRLQVGRPRAQLGVLSTSYPVHPVTQMQDAGAGELWQEASMIDRDLVVGVHEAGGKVYAWTVDDPARMAALAALGVDGVCTNKPAAARLVLA